jgi:pyrophosphatase PpaX
MSIHAVLFDLDGTLVDTIPLIFACYRHTLSVHVPHFQPSRDVIVGNLGRSLDAILYDYAVAAGDEQPAVTAQAMVATYRAFQRENLEKLIRPYEGVREALAQLKALGLTLGVVTSKVEWAARMSYERYGLGEYLDVHVFHDDTVNHKPDPEPLFHAASKGGLDVTRSVYVGDSHHDMAAGKAAGMKTIGVLWGPSTADALRVGGADELAETPGDLVAIAEGWR